MTRPYKKKKKRDLKCCDCGSGFRSSAPNAIRCPACRLKRERKAIKDWYFTHKSKQVKPKRVLKSELIGETGDLDYSLGPKYCKKYNNDNIKCVMCYEQYQDKECRER